MNINLGKVLAFLPAVLGIVERVQKLFGDEAGSDRKTIAVEVASDVVAVINGVSSEAMISQPGVKALVEEAVQIAYDIMKLRERLTSIDEKLSNLRDDPDAPEPAVTRGADANAAATTGTGAAGSETAHHGRSGKK